MRRFVLWVPLVVFAIFVATVAVGLYAPSERIIHSQMIGKPMPDFALPGAVPGRAGLSRADLVTGQPQLVNVMASWCIPCIVEAPQLMELKRRGIPVEAIAVRDRPQDVADFLQRWGDPFNRIASDTDSRVQLALGSAGLPETLVIDGKGVIRHQHIGEIRPEDVPAIVKALEDAQ